MRPIPFIDYQRDKRADRLSAMEKSLRLWDWICWAITIAGIAWGIVVWHAWVAANDAKVRADLAFRCPECRSQGERGEPGK